MSNIPNYSSSRSLKKTIPEKYYLDSVISSFPERINNLRDTDMQMWILTYFLEILAITKVCELALDFSTVEEMPTDFIVEWSKIWASSAISPFNKKDFDNYSNPLQGFIEEHSDKWRLDLLKFSQFSIESRIGTISRSL
jgi:hypothetical protein